MDFDLAGNLIPSGSTHYRREFTFDDGVLPTGLTVPSGVGTSYEGAVTSFVAPSAGLSGMNITTAPVSGRRAEIRTPDIDLTKVRACRITLDVTGGRTPSATVLMGWRDLTGSLRGLEFINQSSSAVGASFRASRVGPATSMAVAGYWWDAATATTRHHIALHLVTAERRCTLLSSDGQVIDDYTFETAEMDLGVVTPFVAIVTSNATSKTLLIHRVVFERWQ